MHNTLTQIDLSRFGKIKQRGRISPIVRKKVEREQSSGVRRAVVCSFREAKLERLESKWSEEVINLSSPSDICENPYFKQIVAIGFDALPYIMKNMHRDPLSWSLVLHAITGVNPVPREDRGVARHTLTAWREYFRASGYDRPC